MTNTANAPKLGRTETILLNLDDGAFGAIYRVAIGFSILPAMSLLLGNNVSDWALIPFLLSTLLMLRLVPVLIRRVVPFSQPLRQIWAERRQMAKRYDSYQWRKLVWFAAGLALYIAISGQSSPFRMAFVSGCLLAGAAGAAMWHVVQK